MWNDLVGQVGNPPVWEKERRYQIFQIDIENPPQSIALADGYSGFAAVLRSEGCPVGFFMEPLPSGSFMNRAPICSRVFQYAGKQILAEKLYRELRGPLDLDAFPSLDIAICTHGRPDALARCLESLRRLGCIPGTKELRVLVIDNAPPDGRTAEVVRQFTGVVYVVEPKPGLDFARNRALREASDGLLAFLDDDVVVDSCWLEGLREAWAANPDAGGFMGPILPFELETRAQVVFEEMGGFGKNFARERFSSAIPDSSTYPVGAGLFGAGANMAFHTAALRRLNGFDDALDTGAPLPGGGDLDIFYRMVRAGYPLVREPKLLVYHQHRREYVKLRHQMWTWGQGTMAYLTKAWRTDIEARPRIRRWVLWWACYQASKILVPFLRKDRRRWPRDMVLAELAGAAHGLLGEYDRSLARIARLRRKFA
jgi:GT2 family glycosyltransferase